MLKKKLFVSREYISEDSKLIIATGSQSDSGKDEIQEYFHPSSESSTVIGLCSFHNHHRYSSLGHKTPDQITQEWLPPMIYDGRFNVEERIPLEEGSIYFVRFIRSNYKLHLPTESFRVDQSLKYSYVVAEISVENHCLFVQQNNKVIQTFEYPMSVDW